MNKTELINDLKKKIINTKLYEQKAMSVISSKDVLEWVNTCPICGAKALREEEIDSAIEYSRDIKEFIGVLRLKHTHKIHSKPKS